MQETVFGSRHAFSSVYRIPCKQPQTTQASCYNQSHVSIPQSLLSSIGNSSRFPRSIAVLVSSLPRKRSPSVGDLVTYRPSSLNVPYQAGVALLCIPHVLCYTMTRIVPMRQVNTPVIALSRCLRVNRILLLKTQKIFYPGITQILYPGTWYCSPYLLKQLVRVM